MKFSLRLAVAFFILSTLPVALVSYISTLNAEQAIEQELSNHLAAITAMREADFNRWVQSLERMIESIAQRPLVVDLTAAVAAQAEQLIASDPSVATELLHTHLMPHLRVEGLFKTLAIADARTGLVIVSTEPDQVGRFRIGETYFEEALAATYVGDVKYTPALEGLALHVGTPIGRPSEAPTAVLIGEVDLRVIEEIISGVEDMHATEVVFLVNRYGFFVTEPGLGEGHTLRRAAQSEGVDRALAGETGMAWYTDYRGIPVLGAFRWLPDRQMALIAKIDRSEALAPIEHMRTLALSVVLGAIALFTTLGLVLSWRMTEPFRQIVMSAARIGRGEFGHRIALRRKDELGDLAGAFDRMAENLSEITASRDDLNREIARRTLAEDRLLETVSALQVSEATFRLLSEASPSGVFIVQGMKFRYVNPAFESMFGYEVRDVIDQLGPLEMTPPDQHRRLLDHMEETLTRSAASTPLQFTAERKDGKRLHCEVLARAIEFEGEPALVGTVADTTLRAQAEERFRLAAEVASDLIYEWDVETDELRWFGDIDGALGFSPGEIPHTIEGWVSRIHPEDQERLSGAVERHRTETRPIHEVYRIRCKDGGWRHWIDRGVPVLLGADRPHRWIGVCIDDTERIEAYRALSDSEGRFRRILENALDIIYRYRLTPTPGFDFISPAVYAVAGYTPAEYYADPMLRMRVIHPDDRHYLEDLMRGKAQGGTNDVRWMHKDGHVVWIEDQHVAIRDENGELVAIEGVARDITEYKHALEALRVSEEQHRSLFENSALGIYQTTPDGRILAANPALVRMLGYDSFEELAERNLEEEGYEPERPRSQFKAHLEREGRIDGMEAAWTRKDGKRLTARENAVAVRGDDGNILFYEGTVEDITAQREAEAAQQELEAQLRQTQKLESIGTLASGVAHEINNPLTGIINYAELISSRVQDGRLKEFADSIMAEGARVAEIVRNLLSFARREKEGHSPARLVDILSAAMSLIGEMLKKDRIHLDIDVPEDLPKLKCRSQQIQQVLLNLLTNARDALNERYPRDDQDKVIRVMARPITEEGATWIRTVVEDHGTGIPGADLDRVFDPFFTTKPRDRGTGLGLSVSYGIVREHQGRMSIESERGAFTRVILDLPADNGWSLSAGEDPERDRKANDGQNPDRR